jgi:hypothetical protein
MPQIKGLFVAVPAYGGNIKTECVKTLLMTQRVCGSRRVYFSLAYISIADPAIARNVLASWFLTTEMDAMLFIDHDMGVPEATIVKMLDADKPVIACVYPKRALNLERALEFSKAGASASSAVRQASEFTITRGAFQAEPIVDGMCRAEGVGTGVMLIHRSALTAMVGTGLIRCARSHPHAELEGAPLYGFFDTVIVGDAHVSEDYAFCKRYRELCDGEIWCLTDEPILHIGDFPFEASYGARPVRLRRRPAQR